MVRTAPGLPWSLSVHLSLNLCSRNTLWVPWISHDASLSAGTELLLFEDVMIRLNTRGQQSERWVSKRQTVIITWPHVHDITLCGGRNIKLSVKQFVITERRRRGEGRGKEEYRRRRKWGEERRKGGGSISMMVWPEERERVCVFSVWRHTEDVCLSLPVLQSGMLRNNGGKSLLLLTPVDDIIIKLWPHWLISLCSQTNKHTF